MTREILATDGGVSASFSTFVIESFDNMISSINYIVLVLIISAGTLAFVVLYNLTNINISERIKEIATIKVLGLFRPRGKRLCLQGNLPFKPYRHGGRSVFGRVSLPLCGLYRRNGIYNVRADDLSEILYFCGGYNNRVHRGG